MWPFNKKPAPIQWGIVGGVAEAAYIALIIWLINTLVTSFTSSSRADEAEQLMPFFMLVTLVVSAAISALLIFGYPVALAVKGNFRAGLLAAGMALASLIVCGGLFWLVYLV